jgi:hypothetical protein
MIAQAASDLDLKDLQGKKAEAEKVLEIAVELQESVASEAKQLMLMASESTKKDSGSEPEEVVNISLDSASSSSSDSDDDIPLAQLFQKPVNSHSTSTKTNTEPSQPSSYEPVGHIINEKLAEIAEQRDRVISGILRHHPQPLNIPPLNMILPENVESNSEKASETTPEAAASENVVSESPHQQPPEPHKPSSPPQPQSPAANIDPQLNIQTPTSPHQPPTVTETDSPQNQQPEQTFPNPTPMDIDNPQVNLQVSTSTSQIASDQPSQQITIPESNPVQDLMLSDSEQGY